MVLLVVHFFATRCTSPSSSSALRSSPTSTFVFASKVVVMSPSCMRFVRLSRRGSSREFSLA